MLLFVLLFLPTCHNIGNKICISRYLLFGRQLHICGMQFSSETQVAHRHLASRHLQIFSRWTNERWTRRTTARRQTSRRACGGGGASTNVSPVLLRVLAAMRPHRHLASSAVVYGVLEVILYFETFEHFEIRVISMSPPSYRNAKRRH